MVELECRACRYKFKRSAVPARCPYCSKQGAVTQIRSAQDFIDEIGDIEEDRKGRNI